MKRVFNYFSGVRLELKKVSWSSKQELIGSTLIVFAFAIILGIFHSGSDTSAALMVDDKVQAYVEEERLIRVKHAAGSFPINSIDYVLKKCPRN